MEMSLPLPSAAGSARCSFGADELRPETRKRRPEIRTRMPERGTCTESGEASFLRGQVRQVMSVPVDNCPPATLRWGLRPVSPSPSEQFGFLTSRPRIVQRHNWPLSKSSMGNGIRGSAFLMPLQSLVEMIGARSVNNKRQ